MIFKNLSARFEELLDSLKKRTKITEEDLDKTMREIRKALLEADVALPVVKDIVVKMKERAIGQNVLKSISSSQQIIKIVNDALVEMLGSESSSINLKAVPPVSVIMAGIQGSGKTTTTAKLGFHLKSKLNKKVLMSSLDIYRPAAQEQLRILGMQNSIDTAPIIENQLPVDIAKRSLDMGKLSNYDIILFDTAGRTQIDESMMSELKKLNEVIKPVELFLVADALTGQDAVNIAKEFAAKVNITGVVLTRIDGDGRGGAALSIKHIVDRPIKFVGVGEKIDDLDIFYPDRVAQRILGMGDVVSLVEKASEVADQEKMKKTAQNIQKGSFDLNDFLEQINQISKIGGLNSLLGMLPGVNKLQKNISNSVANSNLLAMQKAIIQSMTKIERARPKIVSGSRKKRIASGSGASIQEINKLLKQHRQMAEMMKKMSKGGQLGGKFPKNFNLKDLPIDPLSGLKK